MADDRSNFPELMQRVASGSQEAARELVERYGSHVLRIVRRNLNPSLRPKFDSADFVQAVWASFFALVPRQHYHFDRSEALAAFLANLARNKVVEAVRQRLLSQKYNVGRERSLEPSCGRLVSREPGPVDIAVAREEWDRLLNEQPALYQQILVSLGGGETQREVARHLGVNERTVRRVVRRLSRAPRPGDER